MAGTLHRGDGGETGLGSGQRVRKDDPRIECVGSIDELSSFLGLALAVLLAEGSARGRPEAGELATRLARIQRELYLLGAELGRRDGADSTSQITLEHVQELDREIVEVDAKLPKLRGFILPGGGLAAAHLHVARAICRRAERLVVHLASVEGLGAQVVPYLNRLSLVLFSMARQAAHQAGTQDEPA
jgi:cob(I)alamin adenosyltransferase